MALSLDEDSSEQNATRNLKHNVTTNNPTSNAGSYHIYFTRKQVTILFLFMFIVIITLILLLVITSINSAKHNDDLVKTNLAENKNEETTNAPNVTMLGTNGKLTLVSRLDWLAQPPVEPANPLSVPVPYVIIHHTATENCSSQAQCVFHVRFIQTFHIESRHWWDIGYNFLIGGDGAAYEGRGWKSEGAHTYGYNAKSIGIAFIGTFNSFKPPDRQILACKRLIQKGLELGYIQKNYKLLAARQLQTSQSPGEALYEEVRTWDHWSKAL